MAREPLEVQASFGGRIAGGVVLVALATLPCLASAVFGVAENSEGRKIGLALGMMVVNGVVFGLVPGLMVYRRRRSVMRFDSTGVTRFDGKQLPWSELKGTQRFMKRLRSGATVLWQVELRFTHGTAIVMPMMVSNTETVVPAVEAIEAGKNPFV